MSRPAPPTPSSPFLPTLFANRTVLITGGGTGIGLGMAKAFAAHGANVFVSGRREEVLRAACEREIRGRVQAGFASGDVRDPAQCERVVRACVERFGGVDVLINNAAGNFATAAEDLSPNALKSVMEIDFHGTFNMSKAALPHLKRAPGGGVILNTSATLYYKVFPFQMHASAAKSAIDVMTASLGVEWGAEHGVRVVSIAPGPIENTVGGPTGRVFGGFTGDTDPEQVKRKADSRVREVVPIGRYGTVDDIAYTAMFLASPAGSFINATKVVVDGGHWHEASATFLRGRDLIREISANERRSTKGGVTKEGGGGGRSKL